MTCATTSSLGVVGMECEAVAGTPDRRRRALASFEPHHDQNNQPTRTSKDHQPEAGKHKQSRPTSRSRRQKPAPLPNMVQSSTSTAGRGYGSAKHG